MAEAQVTVHYREVEAYPGYWVGSDGSIWSCRRRWRGLVPDAPRVLLKQHDNNGYRTVGLFTAGRIHRSVYVHRLVLEAFVGPCPEGMECRHLNGVRSDNRIENLAWGTHEENLNDREAHHGYRYVRRGSGHPNARLNDAQVRAIRACYRPGTVTQEQLAAEHGVSPRTIRLILSGRTWRHLLE